VIPDRSSSRRCSRRVGAAARRIRAPPWVRAAAALPVLALAASSAASAWWDRWARASATAVRRRRAGSSKRAPGLERAGHGSYGSWSAGCSATSRARVWRRVGRSSVCRARDSSDSATSVRTPRVPQLQRDVDDSELDRIYGFVASGGLAVVVGDHTDVAGVMAGSNRLLDRTSVQMQFDSAKSLGSVHRAFSRCRLPWLPRPFDWRAFPYGVGCSLHVGAPAIPVLRIERGFADVGNLANFIGARLGNYDLDPSESYGGVTVVARQPWGDGEFVVLGTRPRSRTGRSTSRRHVSSRISGDGGIEERIHGVDRRGRRRASLLAWCATRSSRA